MLVRTSSTARNSPHRAYYGQLQFLTSPLSRVSTHLSGHIISYCCWPTMRLGNACVKPTPAGVQGWEALGIFITVALPAMSSRSTNQTFAEHSPGARGVTQVPRYTQRLGWGSPVPNSALVCAAPHTAVLLVLQGDLPRPTNHVSRRPISSSPRCKSPPRLPLCPRRSANLTPTHFS